VILVGIVRGVRVRFMMHSWVGVGGGIRVWKMRAYRFRAWDGIMGAGLYWHCAPVDTVSMSISYHSTRAIEFKVACSKRVAIHTCSQPLTFGTEECTRALIGRGWREEGQAYSKGLPVRA
jgi:hypothetical protein